MKGKRKYLRVVLFIVLFCCIYVALDAFFFNDKGISSVWDTVQQKGSTSDVLIMGNSHIYTAVNTDVLSQALDKDINIMASSAAYISMLTEDFKTLLAYHTPRVLVIEASSVTANVRERMQTEAISATYQNFDGIRNPIYRLRSLLRIVKPESIPAGMSQLLRPSMMWSRLSVPFDRAKRADQNPFDQYDRRGYSARSTFPMIAPDYTLDEAAGKIQSTMASIKPLPLPEDNERAYREMLSLARDRGIEIWVLITPALNQTHLAGMLQSVIDIGIEYGATHVDALWEDIEAIGLVPDDFYDAGHLNRKGAEKLTVYYGDIIAPRLDATPDYDRVFSYQTESVEPTEDGRFAYTMENYMPGTQFRFSLLERGAAIDTQPFSQDNRYLCDRDVRADSVYAVQVTMLPPGAPTDAQTIRTQGQTVKYMTQNTAVLGDLVPVSVQRDAIAVQQDGTTFTWTDTQDYGTPVQYAWYVYGPQGSNADPVLKQMYTRSPSFTYTFEDGGPYSIKLFVLPDLGEKNSTFIGDVRRQADGWVFEPLEDEKPIVLTLDPDAISVRQRNNTFTFTDTQDYGTPVQHAWYVYGPEGLDANPLLKQMYTDSNVLQFTFTEEGPHPIRMYVRPQKGETVLQIIGEVVPLDGGWTFVPQSSTP